MLVGGNPEMHTSVYTQQLHGALTVTDQQWWILHARVTVREMWENTAHIVYQCKKEKELEKRFASTLLHFYAFQRRLKQKTVFKKVY